MNQTQTISTGTVQIMPKVKQEIDETIVELIYQSYPRRVGKGRALKAIRRALKKVSAPLLLEMTRRYAEAWRNATPDEMLYVRYPATFFNDEGWEESPDTWGPKRSYKKPDAPLFERVRQLQNAIQTHPANPNWIRFDKTRVTDAMRSELRELRDKLAKLEAEQLRQL